MPDCSYGLSNPSPQMDRDGRGEEAGRDGVGIAFAVYRDTHVNNGRGENLLVGSNCQGTHLSAAEIALAAGTSSRNRAGFQGDVR